jgi:DNA processing protein
MVSIRENAALIALVRRGERSAQAYADLIEEAGSALAVLEREGPQTALFDPSDQELDAITAEIVTWQAEGIELISVLDPRYPENLRAVHDRPPLLFVNGALQPGDARCVAVIGSRQASPEGLRKAARVAAHLADSGYTVVSGLAAGIDTAVHEAALDRSKRTVAVIGTGLRHSYPPQNEALQRRIADRCAVVSQFFPDAPPTRRSFPMRNAVMSGIALATVIIEASERSGARIQSRLALAQGRRVFVLDSLLSQDWVRELVARPGTHVVSAPEEITETIERVTAADVLVA